MAPGPAIPAGPHDITVDWLRQALARSAGFDPPQLRAVRVEPVGSGRGLFSTVMRCRLAWASVATRQPRSVIVKLHSQDRKTFRLARLLKLYRREYDFYQRIRPSAAIRSPELLFAEFAPYSHRFAIVLEDLADLHSPSQVDGASPSQAISAVRAVARMHGRYWNNFNQSVLSGIPDYTEKYRRLPSSLCIQPGAHPPPVRALVHPRNPSSRQYMGPDCRSPRPNIAWTQDFHAWRFQIGQPLFRRTGYG